MPAQRRAQGLVPVSVDEVAPLDRDRAVALVRLADDRVMVVPIARDGGMWRRAVAGDQVSTAVLSASAPFGVELLAEVPTCDSSVERVLTADMSNELVVVDEVLAVKWQLFAEQGHLAGPRLTSHLFRVGFDQTPTPVAVVTWNERLIASATRFLPDAVDGWEWMVEDVVAYATGDAEVPTWPSDVGALVARFHRACATPSDVIAKPVVTSESLAPWVDHYRDLLARIPTLDDEMQSALKPWLPRFTHAITQLSQARNIVAIPLHGDLHAGQLLRWSGGLAVSDFDGNPLLPAEYRADPGPAAFDLACILRSVDHVAQVVAKRARELNRKAAADIALDWSIAARRELRSEYVRAVEPQLCAAELVDAFESLSPLHEAVYAATYLPRWRYVPLGVLARGW